MATSITDEQLAEWTNKCPYNTRWPHKVVLALIAEVRRLRATPHNAAMVPITDEQLAEWEKRCGGPGGYKPQWTHRAILELIAEVRRLRSALHEAR